MKIQINFKMFDTITVQYLQQNNYCPVLLNEVRYLNV